MEFLTALESNCKPILTKHQLEDVEEEEEEEVLPPVSPLSQSLNSSMISLYVMGFFELENLIDEAQTLEFLQNELLPICPRFSSVIVTDKEGLQRWKKVDIRVEDHLIIPTFSQGIQSREDSDELIREYLSKISCEKMSDNKPMWEAHLIKYPSLHGACTLIFKFSHAMGDGYSFVKVVCHGLKRADNPSLPFTFPNLSLKKGGSSIIGSLLGFFPKCKNTISDIIRSGKMATSFEDSPSAIRSGTSAEMEPRPFDVHSLSLSLERVKQVKSKLGATVNDVITGLISYVIHLYMVRMGQVSSADSTMTILVMLNMRVLKGYKSINEMIQATDTSGNHSRFLHLPIPSFPNTDKVGPLDFINKAKEGMNKKKNSMYIYLIDTIINITGRIFGQPGLDDMVHRGFSKTSTMITSVVGPNEKMSLIGSPVGGFYFIVAGIPQSVTFSSVSSMGVLKLVSTMEKGFIDSKVFSSCMDEAFENIFEAAFATGNDIFKKSN